MYYKFACYTHYKNGYKNGYNSYYNFFPEKIICSSWCFYPQNSEKRRKSFAFRLYELCDAPSLLLDRRIYFLRLFVPVIACDRHTSTAGIFRILIFAFVNLWHQSFPLLLCVHWAFFVLPDLLSKTQSLIRIPEGILINIFAVPPSLQFFFLS